MLSTYTKKQLCDEAKIAVKDYRKFDRTAKLQDWELKISEHLVTLAVKIVTASGLKTHNVAL